MNNETLLKLAAKAAGIRNILDVTYSGLWYNDTNAEEDSLWNPLTNDGDALRLAVKLKITPVFEWEDHLEANFWEENICCSVEQEFNDSPYKATRRAITKAAAEIGKHHAPKKTICDNFGRCNCTQEAGCDYNNTNEKSQYGDH